VPGDVAGRAGSPGAALRLGSLRAGPRSR
jgi:hypothetical protein